MVYLVALHPNQPFVQWIPRTKWGGIKLISELVKECVDLHCNFSIYLQAMLLN